MKEHEFQVGDYVKYTDELGHKTMPKHYPQPGTVGRVLRVCTGTCLVQWPEGSTSQQDRWYASKGELAVAEAPKDVKKLQAMVALCCFASLVLGMHTIQLLFLELWVEALCCCVGAAAAMLKGMELDRRAQTYPAVEMGADDAEV